tara:strand:- start:659 stop:889 length:231 start_codon:yes stop_codon:yes gene_type:complete
MSKGKKEANLISFKVLITKDGKLVTEISQFPLDKVDDIFSKEDRQTVKSIIKHAKTKLEPLHVYLQKELDSIEVIT